jgi:hypothetical protein
MRGFFLRNPCTSQIFWQSLQRQHDALQAPEKQSDSINSNHLFSSDHPYESHLFLFTVLLIFG